MDGSIVVTVGNRSTSCGFLGLINPQQILADGRMKTEEKRAILAHWACDAHAIPSEPRLRYLPGTPRPVTFSEIMAALAQLDAEEFGNDDDPPPTPVAMRLLSSQPMFKEAA